MRLLIVLLLALLAAVLVPLIAHSEGLSRSGTCAMRWREGGMRMAQERCGSEVSGLDGEVLAAWHAAASGFESVP